MQQNYIAGNQFQNHMLAKFNIDICSTSENMLKIRDREDLVYEYIQSITYLFQLRYGAENPNGLYADFYAFKRDFVRYWRRVSGVEMQELDRIFDDAVITQEMCKSLNTTSVFFGNNTAMTIDDCLYAVYEVLKMI